MQRLSILTGLVVGSIAAGLFVWQTFVPERMSIGTFGWLTALLVLVVGIAAASVVGARPTRSIAHVLYDTENQGERRR